MLSLVDALSGAAGALSLVACGAPFDTIKVLAQTRGVGPLAAARLVLAGGGARALWRGALPALASALTENIVLFSAHGALSRAVATARGADAPPLTSLDTAVLGATSAVFSATSICPAEVLKCRAQAASVASGGGGGGSLPVVTSPILLLRTFGPRVFFSGLPALLARDLPLIAIMFTVESAVSDALLHTGVGADARAIIGGGLGGACAWAVVFPLDVVKSRAQVGAPLSLPHALISASREGALYRGLSAAVVRAFVANAALFWGVRAAERALT